MKVRDKCVIYIAQQKGGYPSRIFTVRECKQRRQSLLFQSRYTIVYVKVREKYDYYALQRTIKVLVAFLSLSAIVLVKILRSHMIF